jgi:hypothetical protein
MRAAAFRHYFVLVSVTDIVRKGGNLLFCVVIQGFSVVNSKLFSLIQRHRNNWWGYIASVILRGGRRTERTNNTNRPNVHVYLPQTAHKLSGFETCSHQPQNQHCGAAGISLFVSYIMTHCKQVAKWAALILRIREVLGSNFEEIRKIKYDYVSLST